MIVNITTYSDTDFVRSFLYKTVALDPIDLTGDILRMHLRAHADDATVFVELTNIEGDPLLYSTASTIEMTDASIGSFRIILRYNVLVRMPVGIYTHSLIRHSSTTGFREDIWRGSWTHTAGPTRWGSS